MDDRDPDAYRELYRAHYATVHRYLAARAPADQVDDLAAETFLVAWRRFGDVPAHVLPWLLNVATKVLANQRRSAERAGALAGRVREVANLDGPGVEQDVERREHRRALLDALETLEPQDRELMLLHVWEDLPARRIAVVLELSPVVTRARLSRARRRLARALQARLDAGPAPAVVRPDTAHRPAPRGTVPNPTTPTTTRTRT
ncbi:RNA polymerase sigma factor [Patulibacter minatonensis]|uniref:RNA polymerase sigma factor n=1 Tax=Patulibacter minatonensis TaxID=298163 RepID=UPI0004B1305E|nr:sigma-70 family RNA polymerase sigma factor [Patulibacter minatonensis]